MVLSNVTHFSPMLYLSSFPGLEAFNTGFSSPFSWCTWWPSLAIVSFWWLLREALVCTHPCTICSLCWRSLTWGCQCLPCPIFWLNYYNIYFGACQIQMFCIHSFAFMESAVLLAMSFDRFVAICHPLRYSVIVTSKRVIRAGLCVILRGPVGLIPIVLLLKAFP